jgi:hypothetical protein
MPERQRVEQFIATVVANRHVEAIVAFYHEDASMQENLGAPRRGRDALVEHETRALRRAARVDTHPAKAVLIDGDRVVINWVFDFYDAAGTCRRLEELALQRWSGDRIIEEQFFYDTATAWAVVEGCAA